MACIVLTDCHHWSIEDAAPDEVEDVIVCDFDHDEPRDAVVVLILRDDYLNAESRDVIAQYDTNHPL